MVWPAVGLSAVGTWLLGGGSLSAFSRGDLLVALSAAFWALHVVVVGQAARYARPIAFTCVQFLTVALCAAGGGSAEAVGFDVAQSGAVEEAFESLKAKHGRMDILVNNAGLSRDGLLVRMKDEDWHQTLEVNLSGAFYCARAAAKIMMKARKGRVITISSIVGEMGNAGQAAYVASKAGLIGLTKSLARELASRQITVNAVTPGFIETDMTAALSDQLKEQMLASIPLGRFGQPREIAELVAFLAGPESAYITGQVFGVNGGMYM